MLERIDDNPAFFRPGPAHPGDGEPGGAAVGSELALIGSNVARLIRDPVAEAVGPGGSGPLDPDRAITLIGQQIYGAMSVRAAEPLPRRCRDAAAEICDFILRGLGA